MEIEPVENFEKEEISKLKRYKAMRIILAFVFFLSSLTFLIFYLASPLARCSSIKITSNTKGINRLALKDGKSSVISTDDVLNGMGVDSSTFSLFVNVQNAKENLLNSSFVSDKFEPVVEVSPFGINVSFHDLFPIAKIDDDVYLSDGTRYPMNASSLTPKQEWVSKNYDIEGGKYVKFIDDAKLEDTHTTSIPSLFDVWELLENDSLNAVRYEVDSDSFYFYWISSASLNFRIKVTSSLLYVFGHGNYVNEFDQIGLEVLSKYTAVKDEKYESCELYWYTLSFGRDDSSGMYHIDYEA